VSAFVGEGATSGASDKPLTDQEYQLLQRLLSDPLSIPTPFKTWLVSYLESSDLTLPLSSVLGLRSLLGITSVGGGTLGILPAGLIFPFGGATAPTGSKLCDGASYSRTSEARLYAAIGTTYGAADGATFKVPDLQERVPVGKGFTPEHNALGKHEGLPPGQRSTRHGHTVNESPHGHGLAVTGGAAGGAVGPFGSSNPPDTVASSSGIQPSATGLTVGPVGYPVDSPSYLTVNFIIVA